MDDGRNTNTNRQWRRSSRCGPRNANCLELNLDHEGVMIRDSKGKATTILQFAEGPWASFLDYCRTFR